MKDVYFTFACVALSAMGVVAYGIHRVRSGAAQFDRTDAVGGTALLGKDVMNGAYWFIGPIARACANAGITPNGLTWFSLLAGLGSGVALGFGLFGLATLLTITCATADILDGWVARITKTGSEVGELFDASADRYTEFAFLGGCVVFYRDSMIAMSISLLALLAAFMVSYSTAKAEAQHIPPPKGPMRRHERAVYLIVGAGFTSMFGMWIAAHWPKMPTTLPMLVSLSVVALAGNYSAILRLTRTGTALRARDSAPPPSK